MGELYNDDRKDKIRFVKDTKGPRILREEIEMALHKMKNKKAAGPDDIVIEMLKNAGEAGIETMTKLANDIYEKGQLPEELCQSVFIALPKTAGSINCEDYRTISLISHITKLIMKVLLERARNKMKSHIAEEQFGFREDRGCRNAIFVLRMLAERAIEVQKDIYICFIDYKKAFDNVKHEELFQTLKETGIDGNDLQLFQELYWNQTAAIKTNGTLGNWIKIKRRSQTGLRALSRLLQPICGKNNGKN